MDRIDKALQKLSKGERGKLKEILRLIQSDKLQYLDVKKLKGREDLFRVRQGSWRIIFQKRNGEIHILTLERRSETTY